MNRLGVNKETRCVAGRIIALELSDCVVDWILALELGGSGLGTSSTVCIPVSLFHANPIP